MENTNTTDNQEVKVLGGRKFYDNQKVAYLLPNDTDESSRLNKQHLVLRFVLQANFVAPVAEQLEKGITVLDSGCGPASWTLDMAQEFPNSKFHGVDVSNIFPNEKKPGNCEFVIANISEKIPYPDNYFDYAHQRLLFLGLTSEMWESNLKELLRVLKPGGYIELLEPDLRDLHNMGPLLKSLQYTLTDVLDSRGIPIRIAHELDTRLAETGFEVKKSGLTYLKLNHGGQAGDMIWDDYKHGCMNIRPLMATNNPAYEDIEAYNIFIDECAAEAKELKVDIIWHTFVAQKPLN